MLRSDETVRWTNENEVLVIMHIVHWLAYQTQPVFPDTIPNTLFQFINQCFHIHIKRNAFLVENLQPVMLAVCLHSALQQHASQNWYR